MKRWSLDSERVASDLEDILRTVRYANASSLENLTWKHQCQCLFVRKNSSLTCDKNHGTIAHLWWAIRNDALFSLSLVAHTHTVRVACVFSFPVNDQFSIWYSCKHQVTFNERYCVDEGRVTRDKIQHFYKWPIRGPYVGNLWKFSLLKILD